ncbi:MAG TPA: DapH/DapD/GlmU-related protein [Syntrophorhabdales bacterium]|nr:DapH/DapD/GlmU-related protein [Syntrophorhabdales bacterium]
MIEKLINRFVSRKIATATPESTYADRWRVYGDYVRIHPTALIDPAASIKLSNPPFPPEACLEIGEYSHIFCTFGFLRPGARIKVGKRCQIGASTLIAAQSIEIGDDVLMAWGITLMDTDAHSLFWEERKNDAIQCYRDYLDDKDNFVKNKDWSHVETAGIKIGDKAWIGFNAAILKGVTIGERSVIGACSVVTEDVPSDSLVTGNPAKIVKRIGNEGPR